MSEPPKLPSLDDLAAFVAPTEDPAPTFFEPSETPRPTLEQQQKANRANLNLANIWNPWAIASREQP